MSKITYKEANRIYNENDVLYYENLDQVYSRIRFSSMLGHCETKVEFDSISDLNFVLYTLSSDGFHVTITNSGYTILINWMT